VQRVIFSGWVRAVISLHYFDTVGWMTKGIRPVKASFHKFLTATTVLRPLHKDNLRYLAPQLKTVGFFGAKFYCLHVLADSK